MIKSNFLWKEFQTANDVPPLTQWILNILCICTMASVISKMWSYVRHIKEMQANWQFGACHVTSSVQLPSAMTSKEDVKISSDGIPVA